MISDECSNRFVPTAATDYWQCPAGIACQPAVFSEAFCRLCYVLRSGINNQQLNWVHVNFRKLDTRICFKSFQYATHRPTGVMCHSSTGIPENSAPRRTRPKPKLGPMEKSAPRRTRPHGELGPHYRGELGPHCGELGPNWNSDQVLVWSTWLSNIMTWHHCIYFHT